LLLVVWGKSLGGNAKTKDAEALAVAGGYPKPCCSALTPGIQIPRENWVLGRCDWRQACAGYGA